MHLAMPKIYRRQAAAVNLKCHNVFKSHICVLKSISISALQYWNFTSALLFGYGKQSRQIGGTRDSGSRVF
jgi:hypothetical protein